MLSSMKKLLLCMVATCLVGSASVMIDGSSSSLPLEYSAGGAWTVGPGGSFDAFAVRFRVPTTSSYTLTSATAALIGEDGNSSTIHFSVYSDILQFPPYVTFSNPDQLVGTSAPVTFPAHTQLDVTGLFNENTLLTAGTTYWLALFIELGNTQKIAWRLADRNDGMSYLLHGSSTWQGGTGNAGAFIVSGEAVPEPSNMSLMALPLALLGFKLRRRK